MRQLVSTLKQDALLDYAVFRLTPTRTRCELFVSSGVVDEKLIETSLLEPYCLHLQAALEQFKQGCYSIRLDPPAGDGGIRQRNWFTKGTMERFVRFVSTPEVLERVSTIDCELTKLDEALSTQFHETLQLDDGTLLLEAPPALTGGYSLSAIQSDKATNCSKLRCTSLDVNGFSTVESARSGLLKAIEARKFMLQKEQGMAFARAAAAGFTMDHISDIMAFSECFGAHRLREACIKYLALYKKKQQAGVLLDEMELPSSETALTHPGNGHGAYGSIKAPSETWSDIHCEVGGLKLDDARGNAALRACRDFYNGVPPADDILSQANNGFETFKIPAFGAGNLGFPGYAHDSLHGYLGNMSSMAISSRVSDRHAQNSLCLNSHFPEPNGVMHMGIVNDGFPMNPDHPVPGIVPHPDGVYARGPTMFEGAAPVPHMQFLMQPPPYPLNNLKAYNDSQNGWVANNGSLLVTEFSGAYSPEDVHRYHDVAFLENGYQSHDNTCYVRHDQSVHQATRDQKSELQASMSPYYDPRNGCFHSGSPSSMRDKPTYDESLSCNIASDADTPISSKKVPLAQYDSQVNIESEGSTSPPKRPSSKRLQLGRGSGKHCGMVVIKNINYITSHSQNESTPSSSANQNVDESDDDEESPKIAIQGPSLFSSDQDSLSLTDCNGKPTKDDVCLANPGQKREASQSRSLWKKSDSLDFTISRTGSKTASGDSFDSESFPENHIIEESQIIIPQDLQFSSGVDYKPLKLPGSFNSDIKTSFQTSKDSTEVEAYHEQNGFVSERADQTSDSFILPERCGRLDAAPFGNHFSESMEGMNQTQNRGLFGINDSFFVPTRSEPIQQTNTSWKSAFTMEAELLSDDHQNIAENEKTEKNYSMGFDDLILLPERTVTHKAVNRSSENPSDFDVNLLGSMCSSSNFNDVSTEHNVAEAQEPQPKGSGSRKVAKSSDPVRENGKLINKKYPIGVRGTKPSRSTDTPSRSVATWTSKRTNPLKSKREKEEEERKRLEDLKLQRQERISARGNLSGITKAVPLTSRVSKSLSPGTKPLTSSTPPYLPRNGQLGPLGKAMDPSLTNSKQKAQVDQSNSGGKRVNRSLSSPLEYTKKNGKPVGK